MATKSSQFPNWGIILPDTQLTSYIPVKTTGTVNPNGRGHFFQGVELSDGRWLVVWSEDDQAADPDRKFHLFTGYAEWADLISMDDSVSATGRTEVFVSNGGSGLQSRMTGSMCWGPGDLIYLCVYRRRCLGLVHWPTCDDPLTEVVYSAVNVYTSADEGVTWDELQGPSFGDYECGAPTNEAQTAFIWEIWGTSQGGTFGTHPVAGEIVQLPGTTTWYYRMPGLASGTHVTNAIFKSINNGQTWSGPEVNDGGSTADYGSLNFGYSGRRMRMESITSTSFGGQKFWAGPAWAAEVMAFHDVSFSRSGVPMGGADHIWFDEQGLWYTTPEELGLTPVGSHEWPDTLQTYAPEGITDYWTITADAAFLVASQDGTKMVIWHIEGCLTWIQGSQCAPPPRIKIPYPKWAFEGEQGPDNPEYLWQLNQNYDTVERLCAATAASKCQLCLRRNPTPEQQEQNWHIIERWANDYVRTAGCLCSGAPPLAGKCYLWLPYKRWSTTSQKPAQELENWLTVERWVEYLQHSDCLQGTAQ